MTAADHATAVQLLRSAAADHLTHLDPAERDELVERITGALDRCARRRAAEAVRPFRELFSGGPDTICRTTWRRDSLADMPGTSTECVEVPMADLRDAFNRADALEAELWPPS